MAHNYAAACDAAMHDQGLDVLLDDHPETFEVWQTGGFCMVLAHKTGENLVLVAANGDDTYLFGYGLEVDYEAQHELSLNLYGVTRDDLKVLVPKFI